MTTITMRPTSEDPPIGIPWADNAGNCIDFSGHTFTVKLRNHRTRTVALTKTSGIAGYDGWQLDGTPVDTWTTGAYNILVTWAAGELANLDDGLYEIDLLAVESSRERPYEGPPILLRIRST